VRLSECLNTYPHTWTRLDQVDPPRRQRCVTERGTKLAAHQLPHPQMDTCPPIRRQLFCQIFFKTGAPRVR
jgi:hypothetical protein